MGNLNQGSLESPRLASGILIVDKGNHARYISNSLRLVLGIRPDVQSIPLAKLKLGDTSTVELSKALERVWASGKPTSVVLSVYTGRVYMWGCELHPSLLEGGVVESVTVVITDVTPEATGETSWAGRSMADSIVMAPGLFMRVDADDLTVRFINPIGRELLRRNGEDLVGRSLLEVIPQSSELMRQMNLVKRYAKPVFFNVYAGKRADDKDLYLRVMIFPSNRKESKEFVITVTDASTAVDDRLKILTNDLARANAHMDTILDVLPVGVLIIDAEGRILEENRAVGSIWRSPPHPDRSDKTHAPEEGDLSRLSAIAADRLSKGLSINGQRENICRADGTDGTVLISAAPMRGVGSAIGDFAMVIQDITEIATLEAELRRRSEVLSSSNAELQQFAYVASHDLQEPLRMVTMYADLLNKRLRNDLDPKAAEYMNYIVQGGERMRQLINDLLTYSRVDSLPLEVKRVDLNKIVDQVIENLQVSIDETNVHVIVQPLPTVAVDELKIRQVVQNLISNAIKFRSDRPLKVEVSSMRKGGEFTIAIKDNGIGIDPKYQDKIFEMFQRLHTREEYEGTGMGLAISKKIVERHGGRIWFESEPGNGTTFFFTIPA